MRTEPVQPRAQNARAIEASLLQWAHAQEEPLDRDMLTLGGSATAVLVKLCGEPFAVLSDGMVNLDHGAFRHCALLPVARVAERLDTKSFLGGCLVRRDPNDCATDYALDVKHVLQESTKKIHPFAALFQLKAH